MASEELSVRLLTAGFGMDEREARRVVMDARLADYGIHDRELRALVGDLILGELPAEVQRELRGFCRRYRHR